MHVYFCYLLILMYISINKTVKFIVLCIFIQIAIFYYDLNLMNNKIGY